MTNLEIYKIVQKYVVFATGLPGASVRLARPNQGVRTAKDRGTIVSINLINSTPIGKDYTLFKDIDGDDLNIEEVVVANRNLTASIKVYGSDAEDIAIKISNNTVRSGAKGVFYSGGIGVLKKGNVLDLTAVLSGSYEETRQLDIQLYIKHVDELNVNVINSATIDVEIQNGSLKLNGKVEVHK